MACKASKRRCRGVALQQAGTGGSPELLAGLVPVGVELGLLETVQDLGHRRPDDDIALGVEVETGSHDGGVDATVEAGPLMVAVGAVLIGQRFPAAAHRLEVEIPQAARLRDQHLL